MKFKSVAVASSTVLAMLVALNVSWAADSASTPPAKAAPPAQTVPPPKIDPRAEELLSRTCGALSSAKAFSFHAEALFDKVLPHSVKIQFAGETDLYLQRPDELAVDYQSDLGGKRFWYRNDRLTIFDQPHQMYASMKVPASIDSMLEQIETTQHLTLPLGDLAFSDPCRVVRKQIIYGGYIGVNDVNGEDCDHVAFSSRNTD